MVFIDVLQEVGGQQVSALVIDGVVVHESGLCVICEETVAVGRNPDAPETAKDELEASPAILDSQCLVVNVGQLVRLLWRKIPQVSAFPVEDNFVASVVGNDLGIVNMYIGMGFQGVATGIVAIGGSIGAQYQLLFLAGDSPDLRWQECLGGEDVQTSTFMGLVDVSLF